MARNITIPFHRAKMMAQAILPHVSNNPVTPVLTLAVIREGRLYGTDRYSVGEFRIQEEKPREYDGWDAKQRGGWDDHNGVEFGVEDGPDDPTWADEFSIPRDALQRIATLSKAQTMSGIWPGSTRVRITEEFGEARLLQSGRVTNPTRDRFILVEVYSDLNNGMVEFAQRFNVPKGNYPPIARLLDEWKPQEGNGPVVFGLMGMNLDKITRFAGKHMPIKVTAGQNPAKSRVTVAPMLVEVGKEFRALIQPTLLTDER